MTIDASSFLALSPSQTSAVEPLAAAEQVEAFTRTLFGHLDKLPDGQAIEKFQETATDINTRLTQARSGVEALTSPLHALAAQTQALHAIAQVDLIAKAAGGISQGINKLTSIQ